MSLVQQSHGAIAISAGASRSRGYLYGPMTDFMLLGGGSVILMAAIWMFLPKTMVAPLSWTMLILSNFINHPHFGYSYQIFYRGFREKAFGVQYSANLRTRYIFAGIIAPALLASFMLGCLFLGFYQALGYGINAMAFFVGWHYVKQGYGILMLDSALKKRFFSTTEKRLFLLNAYATWIFAWVHVNLAIRESNLWGLKTYSFAIPAPLYLLAAAIAITTLIACMYTMVKRVRAGNHIPLNGLLGYCVAIYPWLFVQSFGPAVYLVIPACHSLQYLAVVWRYQLNREKAEAIMNGENIRENAAGLQIAPVKLRFATFLTIGALLGFAGFWGLPVLLDIYIPYDHAPLGNNVFLGMFWIFINIHHYFLDNVMWRRENPDMKKYLFS